MPERGNLLGTGTGTPITSQVVAFNLRRSFLYGQFSKLYLPLLVAHDELKSPTSSFGGIETPDPETIKVKFTKPVSTFIEHLGVRQKRTWRGKHVCMRRQAYTEGLVIGSRV